MKTVFGSCWESFDPAPAPLMKALADLGFGMVRLMGMWPQINPKPGLFIWDQNDKSVDAIKGAGMKLYHSPYWAPAHASGGLPTYEPYTAGCSFDLGGGKIRFASERSYCSDPAPIDPRKSYLFGKALGRRYGSDIDYYAPPINEPGPIYYPPAIRGGDWGAQLAREIIAPFVAGVRSAHPPAVFVGPEADTWDVLDGILRHEAASGERWFDYVSRHPYAWDTSRPFNGFPEDSYERLDQFAAVASDYPARPEWITEIGSGGAPDAKVMDFCREMIRREVPVVLFHNSDMWLDDKNKLTALGARMKGLLA